MKSIKTILVVSSFFFTFIANAQYFPDSLQVTGVQYFPLISQGEGFSVRYYRDSVTLDSFNSANDVFYTVERRVSYWDSLKKFQLRVNNKRVYYTGLVNYSQPFMVTDKLIYDYNLNIGETYVVKLNSDTLLDIKLRLDSAKMQMFRDGNKRMVYYYTKTPRRTPFNNHPFYSAEGLGSSEGISYLKTDNYPEFGNEWLSACIPTKMIYGNPECYVGLYHLTPSCEEDSIELEVNRAQQADIIRQNDDPSLTNVFPNPASGLITLTTSSAGFLTIMDYTGKIHMHHLPYQSGSQKMDISTLSEGLYLLSFQSGTSMIYRKLYVVTNR